MFETLLVKTFSILSLQLFFTWVSTVLTINVFRIKYKDGKWGLKATKNEAGELDIHLDFATVKHYFWGILILSFLLFILLDLHGRDNILIGLPLFSIWSWLTGVTLALCLLSVDENLGSKVLALTACTTLATAVYGMTTTADLSFLEPILFYGLLILILFNILRLVFSIPRHTHKLMAVFGCLIFSIYLIYDFHRLAEASKIPDLNNWLVAMDFAIEIYLDIINLFLEILEIMSD